MSVLMLWHAFMLLGLRFFPLLCGSRVLGFPFRRTEFSRIRRNIVLGERNIIPAELNSVFVGTERNFVQGFPSDFPGIHLRSGRVPVGSGHRNTPRTSEWNGYGYSK
jgi:hypothetical protein